jgi:hypothetical protein
MILWRPEFSVENGERLMTSKIRLLGFAGAVAISALFASPGYAQLTSFQTYTGQDGVSTDGVSSEGDTRTVSASAPAGSTVIAAYLYTAVYNGSNNGNPAPDPTGTTLNGTAVSYTATFPNATACCSLSSSRADVTSIVAPIINAGLGGIYNFNYKELGGVDNGIDGSGLVVVYSNSALPTSTIGILNGAARVTGDTTTINFASPLNPAAPGFVANMFLGIGFSCCGQESNVTVNGNLMTSVAGNMDDSNPASPNFNGQLITVGGIGDPFTVASPGSPATDYSTDHEAYNLIPFITNGDTSITVDTFNASQDDNIFLAVFDVTGQATINGNSTPLPGAVWLFGSVLGISGIVHRRRKRKALVSIPA